MRYDEDGQEEKNADDCEESAGVDPPFQHWHEERVDHSHQDDPKDVGSQGHESSRSVIFSHRGQIIHDTYKTVLIVGNFVFPQRVAGGVIVFHRDEICILGEESERAG